MTILSPITITNYTVNLTENDAPSFNIATTYALAQQVVYNHIIWESLAGSNVGNTPDISPTWWINIGATNAYKAIDNKVSSQTTGTDLEFTWTHGQSSKIYLMNCETNQLTLQVKNGATVLEEHILSGVYRTSDSNYWEWFISPFFYRRNFDIAVQYNPLATIKLNMSGQSKLGIISSGIEESVGNLLWGVQPSFIDYSKKDVDQWGETYLKQGAWSARLSGDIIFPTVDIDHINDIFISRRGKASVYKGGEYDSLKVYGFVRDFEPIMVDNEISTYTLTIEGLI